MPESRIEQRIIEQRMIQEWRMEPKKNEQTEEKDD
jgi:hypothetical protein